MLVIESSVMGTHGGKRKGAGRKRNDPPTSPRCVCLTDEQVKLLRMWGRGDVSAGLRWLIDTVAPMIRRTRKTTSETEPPATE